MIGDTRGTSLASFFVQSFSGSRVKDGNIPEGFAKPLEKAKSLTREWNGNESLILFGFQAPPDEDEDGFAAAVLEGYAGGTGRFSQEIRDRLGIAHRLSVGYRPQLRGGSWIVCAAARPGSEDDLVKALREAIQRVHAGPIADRAFRSAITQASGAYAIRQQARHEQISAIISAVLSGRGIDGYESHSAGLQEVREDELKMVAERILNL